MSHVKTRPLVLRSKLSVRAWVTITASNVAAEDENSIALKFHLTRFLHQMVVWAEAGYVRS
jgi:hypothetical protein